MKQFFPRIKRTEWRFALWVIAAVVFLTQATYIYGYLNSTADAVYNGLHAESSADFNVYFSYIKQISEGHIMLHDYFTSEPQPLGMFNIAWFAIGQLARLLRLRADVAFHLARALLTPLLLVAVYLFFAFIFGEEKKRKTAFLLACFASGVGWITFPLFSLMPAASSRAYDYSFWPLDLFVPDVNLFNTIYGSPHLILSLLCLLLVMALSFLTFERRSLRLATIVGLISLVYLNFHPFYVLPIFTIVPAYLLFLFWQNKKIDWRLVSCLGIIGLLSLPSVIYHGYLILNNYFIGARAGQNVTLVYFLLPILAGYGWLLPAAVCGLGAIFKKKQWPRPLVFCALWLGIGSALLFLPTNFSARYYLGLSLPLTVFATIGIYAGLDWAKKQARLGPLAKNEYLLGVLFILFFSMSHVFNLMRDSYQFYHHHPVFYLSQADFQSLQWLDQAPKPVVVLAGEYDGHVLPGFTGQKVYFAHGMETLFYDQKKVETLWFFGTNESDSQKQQWLRQRDITYIFYSQREKQLGDFDPASKKYLKLVFNSSGTQIYQVIQ